MLEMLIMIIIMCVSPDKVRRVCVDPSVRRVVMCSPGVRVDCPTPCGKLRNAHYDNIMCVSPDKVRRVCVGPSYH